MKSQTPQNYRNKFRVPDGIYLASHSVGALTIGGQSVLERSVSQPWAQKGGEAWNDWLTLIDGFCDAISGLIGGKAESYCPQPNLSAGLTKYLTALPAPTTRTEILMHADAFPSMGFVATAMASRGYTFKLIPSSLPAHDPDVWRDQISKKTACALITHVHSNTGVRSPVSDIIDLCREREVRPLVDIAQSAGIIPIDIETWNADLVLGSCVKWLCGGPGAGFMWVNPDTLPALRPESVGWFSHENPFEFEIDNFRYHTNAKRFWGGTPTVAPYAFALGGIETLADIGVETVRAHNIELMKTVRPTIEPRSQGGTLCIPISESQHAELVDAGCQFDRRGDIARLSFHIYNSLDEAEKVRDILRS